MGITLGSLAFLLGGEKKEQTETKIMQANGKMLTTVFMSRGQAHSKAVK